MTQTYTLALNLHLFFYVLFLCLSIFYLLLTQIGEGIKLVKRVRLFLPLYSCVLAAVIFLGILLISMLNFKMTFEHLVMIVSSFFIIGLIAKNGKALKEAYYLKNYTWYKRVSLFHLTLIFFFIIISGVI